MALGLIYDLDFPNKPEVLGTSVGFVERRYQDLGGGEGQFDPNLIDDAFSIFNPGGARLLPIASGRTVLAEMHRHRGNEKAGLVGGRGFALDERCTVWGGARSRDLSYGRGGEGDSCFSPALRHQGPG